MMKGKIHGFVSTIYLLTIALIVGLPLLFISILGIQWFLKNIVIYALIAFAGYLLLNLPKTKQFLKKPLQSTLGAVLILSGIILVGSFTGMMAVGVSGGNYDIKIETGGTFDTLASYETGAEADSYEQSTFSFTCMSPLSSVFGCRFAPGTYRPLKLDICNKDPELPLPPHLLLVSIDSEKSLKRGAEINLKAEGIPREADWRSDVFIASGDPTKEDGWKETLIEAVSGTSGEYEFAKDEIIIVGSTIPPGECYSDVYGSEIGIDEDGVANLFVVAGRGTKVGSTPILSVALIEMRSVDPIFDSVTNFLGSWGWITPIFTGVGGAIIGSMFLGPVGALVGGALGAVGGRSVNQAIVKLSDVLAYDAPRAIYAVGGYKFLIHYPVVEVFVALGAIAILFIGGTKLLGWW